jgi:hypothetical protein
MRYSSMRVVTWGTMCGAVARALWLAAAGRAPHSMLVDVSRAALRLRGEGPTASRTAPRSPLERHATPVAGPAGASAPTDDPR